MKETAALVVPAIALYIYILLSSIEFGASLFTVFPALFSSESTVADYMNPLWETTTVFLAFSLISLFTFFPGATSVWTAGIFSLLFAFLAAMGVRVVAILLTQYATVRSLAVRMLYFASCFASAVIGMLLCVYFLIGTWHLPETLFIWTALLALSSMLFAASSFFRAYKQSPKLTQLARFFGTLFFVSAAFFLKSVLATVPYFISRPSVAILLPFLLILCIAGSILAEARKRYAAVFVLFTASNAALFFCFFAAHLPYIVYPSATMADSATNAASFNVLAASFGIGIVFVIPAIVLLYRLFVFNTKDEHPQKQ